MSREQVVVYGASTIVVLLLMAWEQWVYRKEKRTHEERNR